MLGPMATGSTADKHMMSRFVICSHCAHDEGRAPDMCCYLQNTSHDVADKERQADLAKDNQRLLDLKANLRRGQDIWLQLYEQIFTKVGACDVMFVARMLTKVASALLSCTSMVPYSPSQHCCVSLALHTQGHNA